MELAWPNAIVFDFDGLILDTESSAFHSTAEIFMDHGAELDLAEWQSFIGTFDHPHWTDVLAERIGRPIETSVAMTKRDRRKLDLLAPEVVRPGVTTLLKAATAGGVPMAVASSSRAEWVVPHLERLGLEQYFSHVMTRTDVDCDPRRTKPAPDIYQLAIDALHVDPSRSVAIEDSPNGVAAAKSAGMACVAIPGPITIGMDFAAADLVVASARELDGPTLAALLAP